MKVVLWEEVKYIYGGLNVSEENDHLGTSVWGG